MFRVESSSLNFNEVGILFSRDARLSCLPFRKHRKDGIHLLYPGLKGKTSGSSRMLDSIKPGKMLLGLCCLQKCYDAIVCPGKERTTHPHAESPQNTRASGIQESFPWGKPDQPRFLNGLKGQWHFLRDPEGLSSGPTAAAEWTPCQWKSEGEAGPCHLALCSELPGNSTHA